LPGVIFRSEPRFKKNSKLKLGASPQPSRCLPGGLEYWDTGMIEECLSAVRQTGVWCAAGSTRRLEYFVFNSNCNMLTAFFKGNYITDNADLSCFCEAFAVSSLRMGIIILKVVPESHSLSTLMSPPWSLINP
jgi:hypothetical protein